MRTYRPFTHLDLGRMTRLCSPQPEWRELEPCGQHSSTSTARRSIPTGSSSCSRPPGLSQAGIDGAGSAISGVTTSQGIGLGIMVVGVAIWFLRANVAFQGVTPIEAGDGDLLEELT